MTVGAHGARTIALAVPPDLPRAQPDPRCPHAAMDPPALGGVQRQHGGGGVAALRARLEAAAAKAASEKDKEAEQRHKGGNK